MAIIETDDINHSLPRLEMRMSKATFWWSQITVITVTFPLWDCSACFFVQHSFFCFQDATCMIHREPLTPSVYGNAWQIAAGGMKKWICACTHTFFPLFCLSFSDAPNQSFTSKLYNKCAKFTRKQLRKMHPQLYYSNQNKTVCSLVCICCDTQHQWGTLKTNRKLALDSSKQNINMMHWFKILINVILRTAWGITDLLKEEITHNVFVNGRIMFLFILFFWKLS